MAAPETFDETKFRELVIYAATRCQDLPHYGKTKLYKILFYADFDAYRRRGRSITGTEYLAWEYGPVPESSQRRLIESGMSGDLALQRIDREHRYIPLRSPQPNVCSGEEMDSINAAIEKVKDDTADGVSKRSHADSLGWLAAYTEHEATGRQVIIPYDTVFVSNRAVDEFEEARLLRWIARYGELQR